MTGNKFIKKAASVRVIWCLVFTLILSSCAAGKKARVRQQKVETIIQTARSYTGTPYKWGGTQRTGMDCSGLLLVSFRAAGVKLPRTSKAQSKYGKKVPLNDLEPGDLVFFATGKHRHRITHAGIVTDVEGRHEVTFIHSSSHLGVVESSLFQEYYRKRFVRARRAF